MTLTDTITTALTAAGIPASDITTPGYNAGASVQRTNDHRTTLSVHADPTDRAGTWWYATDDYDGAVLSESYDLDTVARAVHTWWEEPTT